MEWEIVLAVSRTQQQFNEVKENIRRFKVDAYQKIAMLEEAVKEVTGEVTKAGIWGQKIEEQLNTNTAIATSTTSTITLTASVTTAFARPTSATTALTTPIT